MSTEVLLTALGIMIAALGLVARVTWGAAREIRGLRDVIAQLRLDLAQQRADDREWARDRIDSAIREHAATCPLREPTGVRPPPREP